MSMSQAPRVAVITGAGSGIGAAVALTLAGDGWTVVLAGRHVETLLGTVRRGSGSLDPVVADVTDEASVRELFDTAVAHHGRVDLLFNNAGVSAPARLIDELSLAEWQYVVDVNLTGMFLCTREEFRVMRAQDPQGGRIINNGSVSAHVPRRNSIPYVATKHALTGLTRSLSLDGRHLDICAGQIDIGNAATERNTDTSVGRLQATGKVEAEARIDVRIVANGVRYMASLPPEANVLFMTVMANKMPYVGRG